MGDDDHCGTNIRRHWSGLCRYAYSDNGSNTYADTDNTSGKQNYISTDESADCNADNQEYTYTDIGEYANSYTYSDIYANAGAYLYADSYTGAYEHADTHSGTDEYADADSFAGIRDIFRGTDFGDDAEQWLAGRHRCAD